MRPEADGRELALAKVAARLIGLPPDDVYRRAERHRRRQAQMRNLVIAVLAVLVVVAGASAWFYREELRRNDALLAATLKTATGIVSSAVEQAESHGVPRALTIGLLARAEELFDDMARYGRPTRQLRHRRAWMLIEFARSHSILGDTEKRVARAEEALAILRQLTTEYPGETEYQIDLANALMQVGHARIAQGATKGAGELYDASAAVLRRLMALGQRDDSVIGPLASVYSFIGGVAQSRGLLNEAIDNHRKTLALLEDLGAKDTVGKSYAGRIAGAHRAIGDALLSKGRFGEAKLHFEDCAKQVRAVLDEHPHDHASKGVLSWCLSRIANTLQAAGKAKEGIEIETSILEMRLALLKIDPKNARWLRDRYWSYIRLGDLKLGENDSAAALKDYETALGYVLSAVKQDEHNRILQRELAVVHTRIGNVFLDAGRPAAALDAYQKGYGILRALSEGDRGNLVWKCDLARANNSIADAQRSSGSYLEALASIEQAVAIYRSILAESPGHEAWLGNLAVSFEQLGEVHADNGAAEKALEPFHASREIWTKLAADAAPDPRAGRFLAAINQKIEAISSKSSQPIQAAPTVRRMRTADCGLPLMFVAWL
jgi:tetratricopeptide (TPR) repeat protein